MHKMFIIMQIFSSLCNGKSHKYIFKCRKVAFFMAGAFAETGFQGKFDVFCNYCRFLPLMRWCADYSQLRLRDDYFKDNKRINEMTSYYTEMYIYIYPQNSFFLPAALHWFNRLYKQLSHTADPKAIYWAETLHINFCMNINYLYSRQNQPQRFTVTMRNVFLYSWYHYIFSLSQPPLFFGAF